MKSKSLLWDLFKEDSIKSLFFIRIWLLPLCVSIKKWPPFIVAISLFRIAGDDYLKARKKYKISPLFTRRSLIFYWQISRESNSDRRIWSPAF